MNSKFFLKNAKKEGGEYNRCTKNTPPPSGASHQPQHHTAPPAAREITSNRRATRARNHNTQHPHFIPFSQIFPNITGQYQQQNAKHHQNQHVTPCQRHSAQHSTAEQRAEKNGMHPSQPNGRLARVRSGKCARMPLKRAFVSRAGNYCGMTLNRGSTPRGTLRNVHSHRAWEQMRWIVVNCGQIVPWFVPGDMHRPRFFRFAFGRAGAPPPLPL